MFNLFDSKKVHVSPKTRPISPVTNPADARVAVRISDYPNFSGKSHEWTKFQEKFSAVAELQGLGHLLIENLEHEKLFKDNTSYQNECKILYSILKNSCVSGLALPELMLLKILRMDILHTKPFICITMLREILRSMRILV